jgi:hypothetical protein
MARDFDEEIRKLRQKMEDIDNVIAYFERAARQLPVKDKRSGKSVRPRSGTLLQMKQEARTDRS